MRERDRIDFGALEMLPVRRREGRADQLFKWSEMKRRRSKGPKNHSTNLERAHEQIAKPVSRKKKLAKINAARSSYMAQARAFWRGETDVYP